MFDRTTDDNGIWVSRSTNGGFTWSRMCVPLTLQAPNDDIAACGGPADPRQPGDGVVAFQFDNDPAPPGGSGSNFSVTFHDKEYIAAGPRPEGVAPMPLTTYEEVRPWARAIKTRTGLGPRAGVMPPFFVEKNIGIQHFKDDPSLSDEEVARIARWADNGAPLPGLAGGQHA